MLGARVVRGEADAPDAVDRAGFHEDADPGGEQELSKGRVLLELGPVGPDDDREARLFPAAVIEAADLPAELLRGAGMRSLEDLPACVLVSEEARLSCHHEMLRCGISLPLHLEG